ncbi:MAG: HEPN domain-containing protein [Sedimentisphaerales bacterium]
MTAPLKDDIKQWLVVAESDFRAYTILAGEDVPPAIAVCFHCQQYVEKLLKAVLTLNGIESPKTHDLRSLGISVCQYVADMKALIDKADELTIYGVETRYPAAVEISDTEMKQAVEIATEIGNVLKKYLFKNLKK